MLVIAYLTQIGIDDQVISENSQLGNAAISYSVCLHLVVRGDIVYEMFRAAQFHNLSQL